MAMQTGDDVGILMSHSANDYEQRVSLVFYLFMTEWMTTTWQPTSDQGIALESRRQVLCSAHEHQRHLHYAQ